MELENPIAPAFRKFAIFAVWVSVWIGSAFAQESNLETLKFKLEVALEKLDTPKPDLEQQYQKQLKGLEEKSIEAGDLKSVLLIQNELKNRGATEVDKLPELQRLQKIYVAERQKRTKALNTKRISLYKNYEKKVRGMTVSLTKAGDIEGALKAQAEAERVAVLIEKLAKNIAMPIAASQGFVGHTYLTPSPKRGNDSVTKMVFHADGTATRGGKIWNWDVDSDGVVATFHGKSRDEGNAHIWKFDSDFSSAEVYSRFHKVTKKAKRE